ncbi:glycosyltransferase family 4 protein [Ornithinimicrobium sp. INDO-MA30-4]|uniref:glycosyltransferase family 4 protein n=1 Tax=Ornithinimicrobium sp. INDO-MA30-4 TaxID=2908651 RepID=UPI001F390143|nr:glycosyltransferase family 4 protein [Ornithinimicrobium sp. INDO-MA30-4]UJH69887.1 glycosyltransferase family 4 protein [Ornithinimicrobium sp. INDO-MA30-4]
MVLAAPLALWVIPVADSGGVARHVRDVLRVGIPGWRVVVACPPGPLADDLHAAGHPVVEAQIGPHAGLPASVRAVRRLCSSLRPSIVHTHLSYADVVAAIAVPRGIKLVTTEHGLAGDDTVYHGTSAKSKVMAGVHTARLKRFAAAIAVSGQPRP